VKSNLDGTITVQFKSPEINATPGQVVALFDGETCLGGGVIKQIETNYELNKLSHKIEFSRRKMV